MDNIHGQNPDGTPLFVRDFIGPRYASERPSQHMLAADEHGRADTPADTAAIDERRRDQTDLERSHRDLQKIVAALDILREEEQRRLAHDMHDDLGQLLAAMKMELATLRARLPKNNPQLVAPINNIHELVDTMVVSVRRIIADLPPKVLEDFGLFSALEMLVASFQKRHHILTRLEKPLQEPALPANLRTPIYRMVQEALNNVAKHARATEARISIACSCRLISLTISDNGTGLAPGCLHKPDSFGLIGMRHRAVALGGQASVRTLRDSGTEIHIMLPFAAATEGSA